MDASNRRPQLPALSYLDVDPVKREDDMALQNRSLPALTSASPTVRYPLGPPPPYSHAASPLPHAWPAPDARRTTGDEPETTAAVTRQSLPSLSEALGVDNQPSKSFSASAALEPQPPPPLAFANQPAAPASPSLKRPLAMDVPQAHPPYTSRSDYAAPYSQHQPEARSAQTYAPSETARPAYLLSTDRLSHLPSSKPAARPPPTAADYSRPRAASPGHELPAASSSVPVAPSSFGYGYTPYDSRRYAQPPGMNGSTSGPVYQPSTVFPPPSTASAWKTDSVLSSDGEGPEYGESVKRHLDLFDLGTALQEIASTSSITSDFARRYGDRLHQNARTGPSLQSLPGLVEVDDMIAKSRVHLESLLKIRDFVVTQQAAFEQEAVDQRRQKFYAESQASLDHGEDDVNFKNVFVGSDAKKRRGRTAPPGRCHSCNRAETPEWRRGPDGARTLCNACGLHYAKLTRKQQGAAKSATVGSSTLRPKEA